MNKKVLAVAMAVVLICAAAGAGTMAWFTSAATSSGNQFTAGTLILGSEVNGNDVYEEFATLEFKDMEPGQPPVKVLDTDLKNVGSLPFYLYRMTASNIVDNNSENNIDDMILDDVLMLKIFIGGEQVYYGKLSQLVEENGGFFDPIYGIEPGETRELMIEAELPATTGNAYQGLRMKCDLNIFAAQEEMPVTGQPPLGTRYDLGATSIFSVEGYNSNNYVNFDWDWTPNDNLLGSEYYELRIKHETGDTTTEIEEIRIFILFDEHVVSVDGIDEDDVSVDWSQDIVRIRRNAFPSDWDGFEVELTGAQNGRAPETIPYQYFSLAR